MVAIVLGVGDDEPQVGLDHLLLGVEFPSLDPLRQRKLLRSRKQRDLADALEEELKGVGRRVRREVARRGLPGASLVAASCRGGLLWRGVIDQLDLAPLEEAVQLLDVPLVEVELGDRRRYLTIGQRAALLAACDQRPYLFEFCKLWTRHLASYHLPLPPQKEEGATPRRAIVARCARSPEAQDAPLAA